MASSVDDGRGWVPEPARPRPRPGPPRVVGHDPRPRVRRAVHGGPRPLDRQRGAALDATRPGLQHRRPAVGGQRLRPLLRRLPAPGRARRRPVRSPPHLHARPHPVRRSQPGVRRRPEPVHARRGAHPAGPGCGRAVTGHPDDPHHDLHRPRRAVPRPRDLERHGGGGRRLGGTARRHPHRPAVVAMDLLHQHPHCRRRAGGGPCRAGRDPRRGRAPVARRTRGHRRHRWAGGPGVRRGRHQHTRLVLALDGRAPRDLAGSAWPPSW